MRASDPLVGDKKTSCWEYLDLPCPAVIGVYCDLQSIVLPIMGQYFHSPSQSIECSPNNPKTDYTVVRIIAIMGIAHAAFTFLLSGCFALSTRGNATPVEKRKYTCLTANSVIMSVVAGVWSGILLLQSPPC